MKKLIVLGGGISGLACAYYGKKHFDVTLIEKEKTLGGCLGSFSEKGFFFEKSARIFQGQKSEALLSLIEELGLSSSLIFSSAKKRFLLEKGSLVPFPSFFHPFFWKMLFRLFLFPSPSSHEETVKEFFCRRFSPKEVEKYVDPFVTGIYGGSLDHLSMEACFPRLINKKGKKMVREKRKKSKGLLSLQGGTQELIQALCDQLEDPVIHSSVTCIEVEEKVRIHCSQGVIEGDHLMMTSLSPSLVSLLPEKVRRHLFPVSCVPLVVVGLGYSQSVLKQKGVGYLIASCEREKKQGVECLGATWDSCVFPQHNHGEQERITFMLGKEDESFEQMEEKDFLDCALEYAQEHLKISRSPDFTFVKIYPQAIPQYPLGHLKRVKEMEDGLCTFPVTILGNRLYGVSVNDCIGQARKAVENLSYFRS